MAGRRQHTIDPTYPRAARRAIAQLARTLDKRMDHVEMQDMVINFFVEFLADQNIRLNTNGMFEGTLPTFHTVGRDGRPDSRTFQFHELQQQALKDMLQHNFDNFKIKNDARQQNRKAAHEAVAERLVMWRNRAIAAENENINLIANQGNAGIDANELDAPLGVDTDHEADEQVNDDQNVDPVDDDNADAEAQPDQNQAAQGELQVEANQAQPEIEVAAAGTEIEVNQKQAADDDNLTYEPASYKTAYPNNGDTNGSDTVAVRAAAPAGTEAEVPIKVQPKTSTPIIKKGATAPIPLTSFPVDRLGLNLRHPRNRERVQNWLEAQNPDPEVEMLPPTPEYGPEISEIEFNVNPEDTNLPTTPEHNSVGDIGIDEIEIDDGQTEKVKTKNPLITASFRSFQPSLIFLTLFHSFSTRFTG